MKDNASFDLNESKIDLIKDTTVANDQLLGAEYACTLNKLIKVHECDQFTPIVFQKISALKVILVKRFQNQTILSFDVGTVDEDENLVFQNGCFKKRKACPFFIYAVIFLDTVAVSYEVISLVIQALNWDTDEQSRRRIIINENVVFAPERFAQCCKLFYGYRWLFRGRSRQAFLPYYRVALTANFSQMIGCIFVLIVTWKEKHLNGAYIIFIMISILENIFLTMYLRYMDRISVAKTSVIRDKAIL